MPAAIEPIFYPTAAAFRAWLEKNHARATEQWVGLYKTSAATKGMTYREAVDEALSYGWIDGRTRGLDEARWTIRFTPRRPKSIWSKINLARIEELIALGRVRPAGLAAYQGRDPARAGLYSFENAPRELDAAQAKVFRAKARAWTYFQAQAPSYRRTAIFWVTSAKREATRARRLDQLIAVSARGEWLPHLISPGRRRPKK